MSVADPGIIIEENLPRDGLQNEQVLFSVRERAALIEALVGCGLRRIQIGSFVNPARVPQMAGTEEVFGLLKQREHVIYSALVLNRKGMERAAGCGIGHVSIFVSVSETHSRRNAGCSVDEAMSGALTLIGLAKGMGVTVQAGVMNAFGCHFEGAVAPGRVLEMIGRFAGEGADEINLADTSGLANPAQVESLIPAVRSMTELPLALHLHDTFGFGIANAHAAWRVGVRRFDASCGGLGGCPFIPGASGNLPTEDLAWFFESMGISTGVDLGCAVELVMELERKLGRRLPGRLAHTGYRQFCGGLGSE
ncbi:MAG: hydroxymethylglutaryl-CoA lyase [Syntrophobacteraceae bacterium]|jgi:hydroxymethylglutaryl-CoA lyase|nr:hydroxymethylglutaryl-CoA lyase [Syntrophobacteraceae bacterium]